MIGPEIISVDIASHPCRPRDRSGRQPRQRFRADGVVAVETMTPRLVARRPLTSREAFLLECTQKQETGRRRRPFRRDAIRGAIAVP